MIGENATVANIQFVHVFIKLALHRSRIYGLQRQQISALNRLLLKDVNYFMRVSTVGKCISNSSCVKFQENHDRCTMLVMSKISAEAQAGLILHTI